MTEKQDCEMCKNKDEIAETNCPCARCHNREYHDEGR